MGHLLQIAVILSCDIAITAIAAGQWRSDRELSLMMAPFVLGAWLLSPVAMGII